MHGFITLQQLPAVVARGKNETMQHSCPHSAKYCFFSPVFKHLCVRTVCATTWWPKRWCTLHSVFVWSSRSADCKCGKGQSFSFFFGFYSECRFMSDEVPQFHLSIGFYFKFSTIYKTHLPPQNNTTLKQNQTKTHNIYAQQESDKCSILLLIQIMISSKSSLFYSLPSAQHRWHKCCILPNFALFWSGATL